MNDSLGVGLKTWVGSNSPEFAKIMLKALAVECPLGSSDESCPLYRIRALSQQEKNDWVNSLSDEDIANLYAAHVACLNKKELKNFLPNPAE